MFILCSTVFIYRKPVVLTLFASLYVYHVGVLLLYRLLLDVLLLYIYIVTATAAVSVVMRTPPLPSPPRLDPGNQFTRRKKKVEMCC